MSLADVYIDSRADEAFSNFDCIISGFTEHQVGIDICHERGQH